MSVDGDIVLKAGLDTAGVTKGIQNLSKSISKGLKNAVRLTFGVRSVFALIRRLRSALVEGFGNLAQVHEPFNQAVSEIMTSLNTLRNSFAAAFAPIIEVVAPILVTFINLISRAVAAIGQFIAALTGKEYVTAGEVYVDYAASLDKSSKSSADATKATKEQTKAQKALNKEITHFDDLVILHSDQDTDDGGGSPVGGGAPSYSFSTMPIGDAVSQFAKDFLAAWAKADFTDIGRMLGEKLKFALDSIPWNSIKRTLYNVAKSIATFLNGFLSTPELYYTIGKTVAELLNSAFTFAFSFVENFDWSLWGKAIRDKLLGLLDNIDWKLIEDTMRNFGSGLGTALQTAFDNPEIWASITTTISKGLNSIVDGLIEFLTPVSWESLGSNITKGLQFGLQSIEWQDIYNLANSLGKNLASLLNGLIDRDTAAEIGRTLANVLNTAFTFASSAISNFEWSDWGITIRNKILELLNGIDWQLINDTLLNLGSQLGATLQSIFNNPEIWTDMAITLSNGLNSIIGLLKNLLDGISWDSLGTNITIGLQLGMRSIKWENVYNLVSSFGTDLALFLNGLFDENTFAEIGKTVANLLNSALSVLKNFGSTFNFTNFGTSLATGINNILLHFNTDDLILGINAFVTGFRDAIIAVISGIDWYRFGQVVRDIILDIDWKKTLLAVGSIIWAAINSAIEFFKGLFNVDNISNPFTTALTDLSTTITAIAEKIDFETLSSGFNSLVTALSPAIEGFGAGIVSVFKSLAELGIGFLNNLGPMFQSIANALNSIPPETITKIASGFGKLVTAIVGISLVKDVSGKITKLVSPLSNLATKAVKATTALGTNATGLIGTLFLFAGVMSVLTSDKLDLESLASGISSLVTALSPAIEGFASGFIGVFNKLSDLGVTFLNSLGPMFQSIADALNSVPSETLITVGETFGSLAAAFIAINGAKAVVGVVTGMITSLTELGGVALGVASSMTGIATAAATLGIIANDKSGVFSTPIETDEKEWSTGTAAYSTTIELLKLLQEQYGLTDAEITRLAYDMDHLNDDGLFSSFNSSVEEIRQSLQLSGVDVNNFDASLSSLASTAKTQGKDISAVESYIKGVGDTAVTSDENTSDFAKAFNKFDGLSLRTPLKLALLSGAISVLGKKGTLSETQVSDLQATLDEYDATQPEASMKRIQDAFEKTGISAKDFNSGYATAFKELPKESQTEISEALKIITDSGKDLKKEAETSFENVGVGAQQGISDTSDKVSQSAIDMINGTFDKMDDEAESHSPSKRAMRLGQFIGQGLQMGMTNTKNTLISTANTIIKVISSAMENNISSFSTIGTRLMGQLNSGIVNSTYALANAARNVVIAMYNSAGSINFQNIGYNIATGIYNGLSSRNNTLETLAHNTAVKMYNSARRALDIASPSKKFAYLGEMVAIGLGNGVADNQGVAVNAVTDMTKAMTDEAGNADPSIAISSSIDSWIDNLDSVLTKFSDTVINKFDNLITVFAQLGNINSNLPAIVQGRVIPSSIRASDNANDNISSMLSMLGNLQSLAADRVEISELRTLLVEMFTRYMNFSIGDEQLARHVNNGNMMLDRRYNTVRN